MQQNPWRWPWETGAPPRDPAQPDSHSFISGSESGYCTRIRLPPNLTVIVVYLDPDPAGSVYCTQNRVFSLDPSIVLGSSIVIGWRPCPTFKKFHFWFRIRPGPSIVFGSGSCPTLRSEFHIWIRILLDPAIVLGWGSYPTLLSESHLWIRVQQWAHPNPGPKFLYNK